MYEPQRFGFDTPIINDTNTINSEDKQLARHSDEALNIRDIETKPLVEVCSEMIREPSKSYTRIEINEHKKRAKCVRIKRKSMKKKRVGTLYISAIVFHHKLIKMLRDVYREAREITKLLHRQLIGVFKGQKRLNRIKNMRERIKRNFNYRRRKKNRDGKRTRRISSGMCSGTSRTRNPTLCTTIR